MSSKNLIANRYEVFQHIGQGGMADVFLAIDTILNRQVAIKILRSELCTDAVSILRFEREAQAATALAHKNIVEIYDVGEYKGHHYIVMEYVEGKTLKQVIQSRGCMLKEEAVDIMKQLVSATAEAHKRGIIHRDIKPQNVIVKADGSIKILDFGIALAKGSIQLTQANNVMGSVHYLAPELAKGEPASAQSDIYALGIVLYEMLTGDVPFKAEQAVQVALMQMHNDMPDARSINPTIPQSLENIIIRATAKDPAQRYRSCNQMLQDLNVCLSPEHEHDVKLRLVPVKKVQQELQETAAKSTQAKTGTKKRVVKAAVPKKSKSNRGLLALLIALLSILAIAGIYFALSLGGVLTPAVKTVEVPNLIGLSLTDAKNVCADEGLFLDTSGTTYTLTENTEKGLIIVSDPASGSLVEKGSKVIVTVSSGIGIPVENYVGRSLSDAESSLSSYPYVKLELLEDTGSEETPGTVTRQELMNPGDMFNQDTVSTIRLYYAPYPTVDIPEDIVDKPIDEAVAELEELGITVYTSNLDYSNLSDEEIANLKTGVVISSDPEPGSSYAQKENNFVTLYYY